MGATIERERGHAALVGAMCDRPTMLRLYNRAATRINGRGRERMPLWSDELRGRPWFANDRLARPAPDP